MVCTPYWTAPLPLQLALPTCPKIWARLSSARLFYVWSRCRVRPGDFTWVGPFTNPNFKCWVSVQVGSSCKLLRIYLVTPVCLLKTRPTAVAAITSVSISLFVSFIRLDAPRHPICFFLISWVRLACASCRIWPNVRICSSRCHFWCNVISLL